jgi:hypothetical protein
MDQKIAYLWHEARQVASKCTTVARANGIASAQVDGCVAVLRQYDHVAHASP